MTSQELIAAFDSVAEAPDGVARLRELVLELAVRGKLVAQEPDDEPASVLLERIAAQKARLVKARKIRKHPTLPVVLPDEAVFAAPNGWEWCRLGNVFIKITDGTHRSPPNADSGAFKYVTAKNIKHHGVDLKGITYVNARVHEEIFARCDPEVGDILYIKDGATTGVVTVNNLDEPFSLLSSVGLLKPGGMIDSRYACYAMRSPFFYGQTRSQMTGVAITRVTLDKLNMACLPLPPLAEQRHIVTRVDELMSLLDRLEAARARRDVTRVAGRDSALDALREADTPGEVEAAWKRVAERIDALVCEPADIGPLRQTVLGLAVRGRLVRQDTADEPASVQLDRIAAERGAVAAAGASRKRVPMVGIPRACVPFKVPTGWQWAQFSDVAKIASNLVDPADFRSEPHVAPDNIQKSTGRLLDFRTIREDGVTSGKHRFFPGQILYSKIRPILSKVVVVDFAGLCSADMYPLEPWIDRDFLHKFMLSGPFVDQITSDDNRLAMPKVNQAQLSAVQVPVPPLAEQRRIVARVDKLMGLLDRLEARLAATQNARAAFAGAAVHQLEA